MSAAKSLFTKRWLSDPAAYPIIGVIVGAVGLCTAASTRYLFKSPDVQWNKDDRSNKTVRENQEEGLKFTSHRTPLAYMSPNVINTHGETVKKSRTLSRRNTKEAYAKTNVVPSE